MANRKLNRMRNRESGQVLPLALMGVVLASVIMYSMINTGNRATEKTRVANIADAAALSAATVTAQQLNSIAYLNRAMVANHIGAGHMTAYISWIRYVDEAMDRLEDITNYIPYVNVATDVLEQLADIARRASEPYGTAYLTVVDSVNRVFSTAQLEMSKALFVQVPIVMQEVASESDNNVNINASALSHFHPEEAGIIGIQLLAQEQRLLTFAKTYGIHDLNKEIYRITEASYGKSAQKYAGDMSKEWLTKRGWNKYAIKKDFSNKHKLKSGGMEWCSDDKLKIRDPYTLQFHTVASGDACATELYGSYRGIQTFAGLSSQKNEHQALHILAAVSKSFDDTYNRNGFGLENHLDTDAVTALSIAQVEFVRPLNKRLFYRIDEDEFANLYNPFWRARLVGSSMKDLPKMQRTATTWRDVK